MSVNNITSAKLKQLISIVEKRERVQEELREIESTLSTYLSPELATPAPQMLRKTRKPRSVRAHRALKDLILAALRKANRAGLPIKELSRTLGVKAQNLHVWFSSTGRKVKGVTKVSAGRWAYKGN